MAVTLRALNQDDEAAFFEGFKEWEGEKPHWYTFSWKPGMSFGEMLSILDKEFHGVDLAPDRVPHSMLYAFLDSKIIGRVSIRHTLNENLKKRGGHIGYAVAKKYRNNGYAKVMVQQAILYCKNLGIKSLLVTCAEDNIPSWKIIEHFNGRLEDRVWDDEDQEMIRRYWVEI